MKKTYRVEFTVKNRDSSTETKDILEPFKNSKALKTWLARKLANSYTEVYNLREIDPMNSLTIRVVEVKATEDE